MGRIWAYKISFLLRRQGAHDQAADGEASGRPEAQLGSKRRVRGSLSLRTGHHEWSIMGQVTVYGRGTHWHSHFALDESGRVFLWV